MVNKFYGAVCLTLGTGFASLVYGDERTVILDTITVSGQTIDFADTPGKTTISRSDPNLTLRDFFRNAPGVDFVNNGDGGISNINIRGLGGTPDLYGQNSGRVQLTLDGMILPESFRFGHGSKAHGVGYFDSSTLSNVTIERGPSLSNEVSAVGGVVGLRTKEPEDVLLPDRHLGGQLLAGYDGRYNGKFVTFAGAMQGDKGAMLLQYTRREAQEAKFDSMRTTSRLEQEGNWAYFLQDLADSGLSPEDLSEAELEEFYQDLYGDAPKYDSYTTETKNIADKFQVNSYSFLNKWYWTPHDKHRLGFSLDRFHSNNVKPIQTREDRLAQKSIYQDDSSYMSRLTLALTGTHQGKFFIADRIHWRLARMTTEQRHNNFTEEKTFASDNYSRLIASNRYKTKSEMAQLSLTKQFDLGRLHHQLDYGVNYRNSELSHLLTNQTRLFINQQYINNDNTSSYFPYSKRIEKSIFVSNRWQYDNIPLSLTPMLKYNHLKEYSYQGSDVNLIAGSAGDRYFSDEPRKFKAWDYGLNLGWQPLESHYFSLAYTQSHRFPGYAELSPSSYYHNQFIPNPNLAPEKSRGLSAAWIFKGNWYHQTIELAYTHIKNKLEVVRHHCISDNACAYANLTNLADPVVIRSIEYTGEIDFGKLTPALEGVSLTAVLAYAKGRDKSINKPLNSIAPLNGYSTLAYKNDLLNGFVRVNFAQKKKQKDIGQYDNAVGGTPPAMPGWATLDLGVGLNLNAQASISLVAYNLFNKQYQRWETVSYENVAFRDQLWEAGRAFAVNLDIKF